MAEVTGSAPFSPPEPLTADHDTSGFDCGVPVLDAWLKDRALRNESRFSRCYVVRSGNNVAGYYCISAGSVAREAAPGRLRRNAPDLIPVSVIGRLAVGRSYAGQGLGADLLADALRRVAIASACADRFGAEALVAVRYSSPIATAATAW